MMAIFLRELRELRIVGLPVLVGLAAAVIFLNGPFRDVPLVVGVVGAALGLRQGLLDRRHDADHFARHRAVSAGAIESARSLAALAWGGAILGACLFLRDPLFERAFDAGEAATLPAFWAIVRFATVESSVHTFAPLLALVVIFRVGDRGHELLLFGIAAACLLTRSRLRPFALVLIAGWMLLEGSYSINGMKTESILKAYPSFGLDADGTAHYFERGSDDERRIFHRRLDEDRNEIRVWKTDGQGKWPDGKAALLDPPGAVELDLRFLERKPRRGPIHLLAARKSLEDLLTLTEARRRRTDDSPLEWRREGARCVCYEHATGRELASFEVGTGELEFVMEDSTGQDDSYVALYLAEGGELVRIRCFPERIRRARWLEPLAVDAVVRRPAAGAARRIAGTPNGHALVAYASELLLVNLEGEVQARDTWDAREQPRVTGNHWRRGSLLAPFAGLVTIVGPVHPTGAVVRLRRFDEQGLRRADAVLRPATFGDYVRVLMRGAFGALRPPVLNAWAAASAPPRDWDALQRWWWRDPLFAGWRCWGFLLLSLAIGVRCARWALRTGRQRCATVAGAWAWAAIALLAGPLGLIWMRILVRWTVLAKAGGGERAAHLAAAPATDAPWPEPEPRPTDVIAPASVPRP